MTAYLTTDATTLRGLLDADPGNMTLACALADCLAATPETVLALLAELDRLRTELADARESRRVSDMFLNAYGLNARGPKPKG